MSFTMWTEIRRMQFFNMDDAIFKDHNCPILFVLLGGRFTSVNIWGRTFKTQAYRLTLKISFRVFHSGKKPATASLTHPNRFSLYTLWADFNWFNSGRKNRSTSVGSTHVHQNKAKVKSVTGPSCLTCSLKSNSKLLFFWFKILITLQITSHY